MPDNIDNITIIDNNNEVSDDFYIIDNPNAIKDILSISVNHSITIKNNSSTIQMLITILQGKLTLCFFGCIDAVYGSIRLLILYVLILTNNIRTTYHCFIYYLSSYCLSFSSGLNIRILVRFNFIFKLFATLRLFSNLIINNSLNDFNFVNLTN